MDSGVTTMRGEEVRPPLRASKIYEFFVFWHTGKFLGDMKIFVFLFIFSIHSPFETKIWVFAHQFIWDCDAWCKCSYVVIDPISLEQIFSLY